MWLSALQCHRVCHPAACCASTPERITVGERWRTGTHTYASVRRYEEAYTPLAPEDIDREPPPRVPDKTPYLTSRLQSFQAEIAQYRPGVSRHDFEKKRQAEEGIVEAEPKDLRCALQQAVHACLRVCAACRCASQAALCASSGHGNEDLCANAAQARASIRKAEAHGVEKALDCKSMRLR